MDHNDNKQKKSQEQSKSFAKSIKGSPMYEAMDENNKKALIVMSTQDTDAAIKHMFTDQATGRQLSYSEMRSRYG